MNEGGEEGGEEADLSTVVRETTTASQALENKRGAVHRAAAAALLVALGALFAIETTCSMRLPTPPQPERYDAAAARRRRARSCDANKTHSRDCQRTCFAKKSV